MALRAIWTEASIVLVFVAGGAGLGDADESTVEVFDSDQRALSGGNVFRHMAFLALHASMLPFQGVARPLMIEGLGVPLDERKVEAVVIRVALRAFLAGACPDAKREVQAFVSR